MYCKNLGSSFLEEKLKDIGWEYKLDLYKKYWDFYQSKNQSNKAEISVIIISWRYLEITEESIKKIKLDNADRAIQIIFVNNGSSDDRFSSLEKRVDVYIKLNANTGAYLARNIGSMFAVADIVLFLEDDGIPDEFLLESHILTHDKYDVLSVRGVYLPLTDNIYNRKQHHYYLTENFFPYCSNLEGNTSYKKDIFFQVGGWDDNIRFGHGGIELGIKIAEIDKDLKKQIYSPISIILHDYVEDERALEGKLARQEESLNRLQAKDSRFMEKFYEWSKFYNREELVKVNIDNEKINNRINYIAKHIKQKYSEKTTKYYTLRKSDNENVKVLSKHNRISIFGASKLGAEVLAKLSNNGIVVNKFYDNDQGKWGKEIDGIKVCSPDELVLDEFILVASHWDMEISLQLEELGFIKLEHYAVIK